MKANDIELLTFLCLEDLNPLRLSYKIFFLSKVKDLKLSRFEFSLAEKDIVCVSLYENVDCIAHGFKY